MVNMMNKTKYGLLIDYGYCTGCYSCQIACAQEHGWPEGIIGIEVVKTIQNLPQGRLYLSFFPVPTILCNLCASRTMKGLKPACVKHCMAGCMKYGPVEDLTKEMTKKGRMVLWTSP
jgi:Fe-S-cluster-containing dehydrogenase component